MQKHINICCVYDGWVNIKGYDSYDKAKKIIEYTKWKGKTMSNFNKRFSEIFARREVAEKLSENFSEQEQHEREERLKMIKNLMKNGENK